MKTINQSNNQTIKLSFKLLGGLFFLLVGCQSESDFSDAPVDALTEVEGSYKISAELAKQIALGFFNTDSSYIAGRKTNRSSKIREVSRVAL